MIIRDKNIYLCEKTNNGDIRLLRVYGEYPIIEIPKKLQGYSVTEIGSYCFAPIKKMSSEYRKECEDIERDLPFSYHEIAGKEVNEVILPNTVTTLHSYSFYNCKELVTLTFGAALNEVNGDSFINCSHLHRLIVNASVLKPTGVQFLLNQLNGEIEVIFKEKKETHILFPEYSETYEEIGPAHIFHLQVEGEGFRARKQFQNGIFDIRGYDQIFSTAIGRESTRTLVQMAVMRLCEPIELDSESRDKYKSYVKEHEKVLVETLVKENAEEKILYLCRQNIFSDEGFVFLLQQITAKGWTKLGATIIREKSSHAITSGYSF